MCSQFTEVCSKTKSALFITVVMCVCFVCLCGTVIYMLHVLIKEVNCVIHYVYIRSGNI